MSTFYRRLASKCLEIRLLRLLPADDFAAPLACSLIHTRLQDAPVYEALSYAWGSSEFTRAILIDSTAAPITPNLELALRYLRWPSAQGSRLLWVDALCINQKDLEEKNHQVSIMKQIYQKASCDLAWIGPGPEELDDGTLTELTDGMNLMRQISSHNISQLDIIEWDDEGDNGTKVFEDRSEKSLRRVFQLPSLWNRVWIMQEVACAPRVTLVAGHSTLDWDVIETFLGDQPYSDAFHVAYSHGSLSPVVDGIFRVTKRIHDQRQITQAQLRGEATTDSPLIDGLARFRSSSATDRRDKVYGLLGLATEDHGIRIDYRKTVAQTYTEATVSMIDTGKNLDAICQSPWLLHAGDGKPDAVLDLPSWAVDFSQGDESTTDDLLHLLFAQRGIFSSGSPNCSVPCQLLDERRLRTKGTIIGRVGPIRQNLSYHLWDSSRSPLPQQWMQDYFSDSLLTDKEAIYPITGEPCKQAFWRTLLMDCEAYPIKRLDSKGIEEAGELFDKILRHVPDDIERTTLPSEASDWNQEADLSPNKKALQELHSQLLANTMWTRNFLNHYWKFSVSENGLYVLLQDGTEQGDVLAILDGAKVPLVLRPVGHGRSTRYTVVNTAYVHGYMDGLALSQVKDGSLEEQEILLE